MRQVLKTRVLRELPPRQTPTRVLCGQQCPCCVLTLCMSLPAALAEITEMVAQLHGTMIKMENFQKLHELKKDLIGIDNLVVPGRVRRHAVLAQSWSQEKACPGFGHFRLPLTLPCLLRQWERHGSLGVTQLGPEVMPAPCLYDFSNFVLYILFFKDSFCVFERQSCRERHLSCVHSSNGPRGWGCPRPPAAR